MLKYQILGKINFRLILYTGIVEVLFTILFCYILAVTLQHKPVWLPTISECGELAPEKYVFRGGILFGGILLVVEGVFLHNAKRLSRLGFIFGVIAGIGLVGVACVASNEDLPLHLGKLIRCIYISVDNELCGNKIPQPLPLSLQLYTTQHYVWSTVDCSLLDTIHLSIKATWTNQIRSSCFQHDLTAWST